MTETAHCHLSYSLAVPVARRWLALALSRAGEYPQALIFHFFRRGGCTTVALNGARQAGIQSLDQWQFNAAQRYFPALPANTRAYPLIN